MQKKAEWYRMSLVKANRIEKRAALNPMRNPFCAVFFHVIFVDWLTDNN